MSLASMSLAYARRGLHVFPCQPGTKFPHTAHGFKDATTDLETVRAWWERWPDANIGVACGASNLVVIDVDVKNGAPGAESFMQMIDTHGAETFATLTAVTPSGGRHYFFRGNADDCRPMPGIDLKSNGGYVLVAPSIVDGKPYTWLACDGPQTFAPFPVKLLDGASKIPIVGGADPLTIDEDTPIIAGARNETLARLAGRLRRQGFSAAEMLSLLLTSNQQRCRPPLPEDEVRAIARSIARYDPAERIAPVEPEGDALGLLSVADMYERADGDIEYLIEGMLPAGGIMLLSARPKVGKSELARNLAYAVVTGGEFLGRRVQQGAVLWLAMEEQPAIITERMQALGVTRDLPWLYRCGAAPADALAWLTAAVDKVKPKLIVVDTFNRLTRVDNLNDYSMVTKATEPLLRLSRERGAAQLWLHHNNKATDTTRGVLGSSALVGTVDTTMILTRNDDNLRFAYTEQRSGFDMEEALITMDPDTYRITVSDQRFIAEQRAVERLVLDALRVHEGGLSKGELLERIPRRASLVRSAVSSLVSAGFVIAVGSGVRGDAKRYTLRPLVVSSAPTSIATQAAAERLDAAIDGELDLFAYAQARL